jgi:hypothetical protein
MKNFKFIYLLLAVVGAITFASCEHKYADWTPGEPDKGLGVYFPSTQGFMVAATDTSVDIVVARAKTDDAASVTLRYEAKDASGKATELFTVPSTVDFAAGEAETNLTIAFDGTQLELGKAYSIVIKLDEAEASSYAISEATFSIIIPEPWISMGEGIYFDEILCELFAEADAFRGLGTYVEFEKHELEANRIRVKNPFAPATIGAMWGAVPTWLAYNVEGDAYLEFDIADPNNVRVGQAIDLGAGPGQLFFFNLGMPSSGYDDIVCFVLDSTPIVLADGIIKFPQGNVWLGVVAGGSFLGTFTKTGNANGFMQYYLPGVDFVNYDMEAAYDGMYVSADGSTAKAIFNFALGTDIASYKFAFVPGDVTADPSETAEAIVAGSEDLVIFESDAETKKWEVELTKGVWTLVAVPYTAEGEARLQNTYAYNFYFNGTGEMPEVNIDVVAGTPASFVAEDKKAEVEAEVPGCFYIGLNITANAADIKAMKAWWGPTASYQSALAQGVTHEVLLADYAADLSKLLPVIAETGSATARMNVNNGVEYTIVFGAQTVYGTSIVETLTYTTVPYDGNFAVGEYMFSDATTQSQMVFSLIPGKSYNDFYFVHNYIDGSMWYTKYDETAGTLTNAGVELNYEEYESQWGGIYGAMNEELTQVYGYVSSTTADFKEQAPMVMSVENNAIAGLDTYFAMLVYGYTASTDTVGDVLGAYFNFTPATEVAAAGAGALQARAQSVNAKFNAMMSQVEACEVHSVLASEAKVVIKATPVATSFAMANLSL